MQTYVDALSPRTIDPVVSHEGGVVHAVDHWTRLRRFLILGTDGGTFYTNARDLTIDNLDAVRAALDDDGVRVVREIVAISDAGRAPKNDPALLALALASTHADVNVRRAALAALPQVARIGTHLLHFAAFRKALGGGWGRAARFAIGAWFTSKSAHDLAYQAVKYPSRDGWALADLLRLHHPKTQDAELNAVLRYIVDGWEDVVSEDEDVVVQQLAAFQALPDLIRTVEVLPAMAKAGDIESAAEWIRTSRVPREAVPTGLLNEPRVWDALLPDMGMTAMIRNLGKMTSVGLVARGSDAECIICDRLLDVERLRKARVHPLAVLVAMKVYGQGHGDKGSLKWEPSRRVLNALDEAFYLAFGAVESTGKRICLALDVSGSMTWSTIAGMPLTPREASAAMALVTRAIEPHAMIVAYSHSMVTLDIRPSMRLDEVLRIIERTQMGGTDCSLPMRWAGAMGLDVDAFVSYTDSETGGQRAVWEQLAGYRRRRVKNARHAVVAMQSNGFSIADPDDPRQLDVVGFDTVTPQVLSEFIAGRV